MENEKWNKWPTNSCKETNLSNGRLAKKQPRAIKIENR